MWSGAPGRRYRGPRAYASVGRYCPQRAAVEALGADFPSYARAIAYAIPQNWASAIAVCRDLIVRYYPTRYESAAEVEAAEAAKKQRGIDAIAQVAHAFGVSTR